MSLPVELAHWLEERTPGEWEAGQLHGWLKQAVAEIERLQAQLEAADRLADSMAVLHSCPPSVEDDRVAWRDSRTALAAYEQARQQAGEEK